ncbi:hypothetical protein ACSLPC_28350 [Escherichia coli]|uniref:hypothetical protein n=1 Tax=Escherichia coli TaxID=562 RepID=UPI003EE02AFD
MTSSELELLPVEDLNIIKNQKIKIDSQNAIDYDSILKKIVAFSDEGDFNETFAEIKNEVQRLLRLSDKNSYLSTSQKIMIRMYRHYWSTILEKKYGLTTSGPAKRRSN